MQLEFESEKDNLENELKKKLTKIETDKKMEYDFLTENIKNTVLKLQTENDNYKNLMIQQENKINSLKLEKDNCSNLLNEKSMLLSQRDSEVKQLQNAMNEKEKALINSSSEKSKLIEEISCLKSNDQINKQNELLLLKTNQNYEKLKEQCASYLIENKNLSRHIS